MACECGRAGLQPSVEKPCTASGSSPDCPEAMGTQASPPPAWPQGDLEKAGAWAEPRGRAVPVAQGEGSWGSPGEELTSVSETVGTTCSGAWTWWGNTRLSPQDWAGGLAFKASLGYMFSL